MEKTIILSAEEVDFLTKLLAIEEEKLLNRWERNIDMEDNNVLKINTIRILAGKLEEKEEKKKEVGIDMGEDEEVELTEEETELINNICDALDKMIGEADDEVIAEHIKNDKISLEDYIEKLKSAVVDYFIENNIYKDIDDIDMDIVALACKEYMLDSEVICEAFGME